jgi:hypothetical protein
MIRTTSPVGLADYFEIRFLPGRLLAARPSTVAEYRSCLL